MILELIYQKGFKDEKGKKHKIKSLVQCENPECNKIRIIPKSCVIKYGSKLCRECLLTKGTKPCKSIEDYKELELKSGYRLVGEFKKNANHPTLWICPNGHEIHKTYRSIENHMQCRICSGDSKRNESEYFDLAKEFGIEYLGPFPNSTLRNTNWKCNCGGIMQKSYVSIRYRKSKYCWKCSYFSRAGENNWMYNPNLTEEDRADRRFNQDYLKWTKDVYRKYDYICQKCQRANLAICAHHIFNWADYPNLRTNLNNGVVLCKSCHCKFHGKYGTKQNSLLQLEDFLGKPLTKIDRDKIITRDIHKNVAQGI